MMVETEVTILYRWWSDEDIEISNYQLACLDTHAMNRIDKMREVGYTSGELHYIDGENNFEGWWHLNTKRIHGLEKI